VYWLSLALFSCHWLSPLNFSLAWSKDLHWLSLAVFRPKYVYWLSLALFSFHWLSPLNFLWLSPKICTGLALHYFHLNGLVIWIIGYRGYMNCQSRYLLNENWTTIGPSYQYMKIFISFVHVRAWINLNGIEHKCIRLWAQSKYSAKGLCWIRKLTTVPDIGSWHQ